MCRGDILETNFLFRKELLSLALNKVNFILCTIWFIRVTLNWIQHLSSRGYEIPITMKFLIALLAFAFSTFCLYPLMIFISFFFTCSYYQWTLSALFFYLECPWFKPWFQQNTEASPQRNIHFSFFVIEEVINYICKIIHSFQTPEPAKDSNYRSVTGVTQPLLSEQPRNNVARNAETSATGLFQLRKEPQNNEISNNAVAANRQPENPSGSLLTFENQPSVLRRQTRRNLNDRQTVQKPDEKGDRVAKKRTSSKPKASRKRNGRHKIGWLKTKRRGPVTRGTAAAAATADDEHSDEESQLDSSESEP